MIEAVYDQQIADDLVKVIIIPDIKGVAVGRDVGYYYVELPQLIQRISGTDIREGRIDAVPKEVKAIMDSIDKFNYHTKGGPSPYIKDKDSHGGNFKEDKNNP